ncbi:MAG: hypothetical protein AAFX99_14485 [Myxococcota bacterium]
MAQPPCYLGPLLAVTALVAMALGAVSPAHAQGRSKFAAELHIGLAVPLTNYVKNKTVLISDDNFPRIVDLTNESTFTNLSLIADIRDWELSITYRQFAWGESIIRYEGDRPAQELSEGDIDDAGVQYRELDPAQRTDEPLVSSNGLTLITFCVGQRFYLLDDGVFHTYIPATAGLALAEVTNASGYNFGAIFATGIAADVIFSELVSFVVDARIHGLLTENASGVNQGAQNASATGGNIWSALTSGMAFATVEFGARFTFD